MPSRETVSDKKSKLARVATSNLRTSNGRSLLSASYRRRNKFSATRARLGRHTRTTNHTESHNSRTINLMSAVARSSCHSYPMPEIWSISH